MGSGKSTKNMMWFLIIVVAIIAIGGIFGFGKFGGGLVSTPTQLTTVPSSGTPSGTECALSASKTTLSYAFYDRLEQGTIPGGTTRTSIDKGIYQTGLTTAHIGANLDVLFVNSTAGSPSTAYHNAFIQDLKIPCSYGAYTVDKDKFDGLYQNATLTLTVFNLNAQVISSNNDTISGGGTTNQTTTASTTYNLKMRIDGEDRASTQDLYCIVEATNRTSVKKVLLTGFPGVKEVPVVLPTFYTALTTTNAYWAYEMNPIEGAGSTEGIIVVQQQSGNNFGADQSSWVKVDCLTKEWFLDTDGTVKYATQNRDNTLQSIAHYFTMVGFQ